MKAIKTSIVCLLIIVSSFFLFACGQEKQIESLQISSPTVELFLGNTKYLQLEISPTDASGYKIVWSSSNSEIVSVNSQGKITAKNYGMAFITASVKDSNIKARCKVKVTDGEVYKISLNTDNVKTEYYEGESFDPTGLVVMGYYQSGVTKEIPLENLELSYPEILTEDTTIIVTYEGKSLSFDITVNPEITTQ